MYRLNSEGYSKYPEPYLSTLTISIRFFALGIERLSQLYEAAISQKFEKMGGPKESTKMHNKIEWLVANGFIPREKLEFWWRKKEVRNFTVHKYDSSIIPPGMAVIALESFVSTINQLFGE
jgi:hypothetical protein